MNYYEVMRFLREDNDLTQTELAEKIGSYQRRISYIETGTSQPTIEEIKAYCKYFHVSAYFLLCINWD